MGSVPPELMHSDVEWVNPPDAVESGTRKGAPSVAGAQSAVGRAYSSSSEVERLEEHGDTVGVTEILYRGRGSGIEVPQRMGILFTIREWKLARFEWSRDPEALLATLGE